MVIGNRWDCWPVRRTQNNKRIALNFDVFLFLDRKALSKALRKDGREEGDFLSSWANF
jgi:hypothetical protein